MAEGDLYCARRSGARALASGVLAGLFALPGSVAPALLCAGELSFAVRQAVALDEAPADVDEQSIVVEPDAVASDEAVADAQDGATLQPIARVSEYEPELADSPDLSSQYVVAAEGDAQSSRRGTEAEPQADDVCVDEPAPATSPSASPNAIRSASFNGATPGVTTRNEVLDNWGDPVVDAATGKTLAYELEGFASVAVTFHGDVVETIRVELGQPVETDRLIGKLGLALIRPAALYDADGSIVSTVFPERGVSLSHRPASTDAVATDEDSLDDRDATGAERVYELEIGLIKAEPFVLRAEGSSPRAYSARIADLETALQLDGSSARVRWLLSQAKLAMGEAVAAEKYASEAVELEPRDDEYRLQYVRCLKYLARYDEAVEQTRIVLEGTTASPLQRAQSLEQMALLAALGSKEIQERAIPLHNKAIALADKLTGDGDPAVQVAATQLLVNAHLAVAERIAAGAWEDKDEFVAQWLTRASALAEQMIASGDADESLRLQVAISALIAGAHLNPPIDPEPWIAEAEQAVADVQAKDDDAQGRAEIDWQLGLAYYYATEIAHRRADVETALKYGSHAETRLAPAAESRRELPDTAYVLGRLYFQIGAVHAVLRHDHIAACQWYDRAVEILWQPVPVTPMAMPGQHGDALVSMAVSYWETGNRERAYELTQAGVELVQQGVDEGLLASDALDVPQNNLAAMSRALGKVAPALPAGAGDRAQVAAATAGSETRAASRSGVRNQVRTAARRNVAGNEIRRR